MALIRRKLGECLNLIDRRNTDGRYGIDDVRGVNNLKLMIRTKADVSGRDFTKFQVVNPGDFFFNHRTSRNGSKFSVTYNYDETPHIVTEDYVLFEVSRDDLLLPRWLYLYMCRPEFDRLVIQNSWGSSTEFYNWEDLCDVELDLPSIEVQRKYVAVYEAMLENQRSYEQGLEDLKLACSIQTDVLVKKTKPRKLRGLIERHDERNSDNKFKAAKGVSTAKEFREPTAKVDRSNLSNYKLVRPRQFSFVQTTHNEKVFACALNLSNDVYVVTSVNEVFSTNEDLLLPEYLALFLKRSEFDRYARFHSWGSARETFTWADLEDVEIPVPPVDVQRAAAGLYEALDTRRTINEHLRAQLKDICPILIKGSLDEGSA